MARILLTQPAAPIGQETAGTGSCTSGSCVAIVVGILVGWLAPGFGMAMEPIGTTFVTAMKMLIGPIVFLTIIGGIASVADLKKVGADRASRP